MIQVKTLWERLLSLFMLVAAIFLFAAPCVHENKVINHVHAIHNKLSYSKNFTTCDRSLLTSWTVFTSYSVRFSTYTPFLKSSLSYDKGVEIVLEFIAYKWIKKPNQESNWKFWVTCKLVDEGSNRSVICSLCISRKEHLQLNLNFSFFLLSPS